jgi:hypothetical protein
LKEIFESNPIPSQLGSALSTLSGHHLQLTPHILLVSGSTTSPAER